MAPGHQDEHRLHQVARPLLMTVITTLRPELDAVRVGMAVEQLLLELEVQEEEAYWNSVGQILGALQ